MNKLFLKRICFTVVLFLLSPFLWAQETISPTIDQTMRSHDKIYVVMAVCIVILLVFFLYLIRIDRKVSKKEKSL
ncbi:MAG: CcmD family protein [Ginsengibacter sp.]